MRIKGVCLIAINDGVDSANGDDDFTPFRNIMERIYINGDGADWIKAGADLHGKAHFVLDRFHMQKYIVSATSHLKDLAQAARSEICRAVNGRRKRGT